MKDYEFSGNNNSDFATAPGSADVAYHSPYASSEWIVCEIIQIVCFVIALYILYALIHFYTVQQTRRIYSGHSSGSRWLEKMCIFAVISAIVRFANNQLLLFTWWKTKTHCAVLLNISIALYLIALCPVYMFLWLRQRIFYSNKALKHLYNRVIRFVSWSTIFCFFLVTVISMVLFVFDPHNNAHERVCTDPNEAADLRHEIMNDTAEAAAHKQGLKVNTIAGLLGGAIQSSFLALFLYPLMDNKVRSVRNRNVRCHHSLLRLIRRSFLLSGVCIATDVTIAFGVKGVYNLFPNAVFALIVMYDVNLIINIICIVTTFRRWRRMLFPWLYDCCGKTLLLSSSSSKSDMLQHRTSNVGLNGSNAGSIRIKALPMPNSLELQDPKIPIADVLMFGKVEGLQIRETDPTKLENATLEEKSYQQVDMWEKRNFNNNTSSKLPEFLSFDPKRGSSTTRRYTTGASAKPTNKNNGGTYVSTSRFSWRSKQSKRKVTTKIVMKSESMMLMEKTS